MATWSEEIKTLKDSIRDELLVMNDGDKFYFPTWEEIDTHFSEYEVGVYHWELDELITSNPDIIAYADGSHVGDEWSAKTAAIYMALSEELPTVVDELKEEFREAVTNWFEDASIDGLRIKIEEE